MILFESPRPPRGEELAKERTSNERGQQRHGRGIGSGNGVVKEQVIFRQDGHGRIPLHVLCRHSLPDQWHQPCVHARRRRERRRGPWRPQRTEHGRKQRRQLREFIQRTHQTDDVSVLLAPSSLPQTFPSTVHLLFQTSTSDTNESPDHRRDQRNRVPHGNRLSTQRLLYVGIVGPPRTRVEHLHGLHAVQIRDFALDCKRDFLEPVSATMDAHGVRMRILGILTLSCTNVATSACDRRSGCGA